MRTVSEFDSKNHWIIDRGDGTPSVNLVVLGFIEPLKLLHGTTDAATLDGVPRGMTPEIVDYFRSRGIRVMISIGGITYGDAWEAALAEDATRDWLDPANPVLDYANAMVPARQPSASAAIANWQEHLDGKPQYDPPIPPLAPCKFTAGLYLTGRNVTPECANFTGSVHYATRDFVLNAPPNGAGVTSGLLGYMFWAAECPGTRSECTVPPNGCSGGLGAGSQFFEAPIPMPPLRQDAPTVDVTPIRDTPGFAFGPARPNPFTRVEE